MLKRTLFLSIFLFSASTILWSQDADGDLILDYVDLDSDNDGILDINECVVPIADYSFENTVPYNSIPGWISTSAGSHNLEVSNYTAAANGNQFLYINSFGGTSSTTLDQFSKTYEEGTYTLTVAVGDGIFDRADRNDNQNIIEIGYGSDAASFTILNTVTLDGTATAPGTWTDVNVAVTIAAPNAALGQGILVRITHIASAVPIGTNTVRSDAGNYDNIRITKDTDGDGLSDCIDVDSDDDSCFDGLEAGHEVNGAGQILNSGPNPDGTVIPVDTGYTGTTQALLDANITTCATNYLDFDEDGVPDATDLDDDNDGITNTYDCEIPIPNAGFENFDTLENFIEDWDATNIDDLPESNAGLEDLANIGDGTNYNAAAEGTTYAYINGNASITLNTVYGIFEVGGYTLELSLGDGFSLDNRARNDGQTTVEIGYHNGDYTNFQPIPGATRIIGPWETSNGTWSTFKVTGEVANGDPALGNAISVRITHEQNLDMLQTQGNYDKLVLYRDSDADGISNCKELDSDDDGCPDAAEMGYLINADNTIVRTGENADGTVATTQFLLGTKPAVLDDGISGCGLPSDFDNDGVADGDRFYYNVSNNKQLDIDLDNDNDGITDAEEGCLLGNLGFGGMYNFEFATNVYIFPGANSPEINYWTQTGTGSGVHLVTIDELNNPPNYETDGTGLRDIPDDIGNQNQTMFDDSYAYLIGSSSILQTYNNPVTIGGTPVIEEGHYILTIAIGDAVDYVSQARNDGRSTIELGYNIGADFVVLGQMVVEGYETKNGMWTDFSMDPVEATAASIGNNLLVRITHEGGFANQQQGNYDYLRISFDYDGDGIPDCNDFDSDNDGCPDATEAGFSNNDNDNFIGEGTPIVNGNGFVTGHTYDLTGIYDGSLYPNVRSIAEPVTLDTPLSNITNVCEGQDVTLTITASRAGANPNIEYEWAESTDTGATWTILEGYGIGTNTYTLPTVATAQDSNQYRVRVRGDDYLCFEESTTTLQVTPAPALVTVLPVNIAVCAGEAKEFQISGGDATDILTYSFDAGATTTTTTLDAAGEALVSEVSSATDVVLSILNIEDGATNCVLTITPTLTSTVTVNAEPVITAARTTCAADLLSYEVDITLSAGTITNISEGTQTGTIITGIATGNELIITVDNNGCIRDIILAVPNCTCPTINLPINPVEEAICEGGTNPPISVSLDPLDGGDTITWFANPTGGAALATGLSFTSLETTPNSYTYYAEASEIASGCTSGTRVPVSFIIYPAVTADPLADTPALCDSYTLPGLTAGNNYFTGAGGTGTPLNPGDLITTSQTIFIYAASGTTPSCTGESSFDITIDTTPTLVVLNTQCSLDLSTYEVSLQTTIGILTSSLGTVVGNNRISDIPAGTDITITLTNNGCSDTLVITAPDCYCPTLDIPENQTNGANCEGQPTATVTATMPTSGGDTINWYNTSAGGTPITTGNSFTPIEIIPGTYTYYAENFDSITGCASNRIEVELVILATPTADIRTNETICDSYTLPGLTAGNNYFTGAGGTGTPLNPGDLITTSQTIFIYAASGTTPSCTGESSFDITIDTTPTLVVLNTQCSLDLSTYEVSLQTTIGILTSSLGTVVGNNRISDIPAGTDITITLTNNGCSDTLVITAPDCYCPTLDIPENQTNGANCEGQPTATVTATMPTSGGDTINWYNTSAGGTPITTGNSFTPIEIIPGTYTYYAENFDSITGCASNRIEVMLTITAIPTITLVANSTSCEFYTLPNLAADQAYFTGTNGTGITLTAGQTITTTQTIYILATAPENTNCQTETSFDITILQEPILDLPTELALCADANDNQQELFLGTNLGPGFRYDWTPNNDTNGDGIEEAIFRITTEGTYTLEVYEIANGSECGGFTTYSTNVSNVAQPVSLTVEVTAEGYELDSGNRIRLLAGDDPLLYDQFEYSITGPNGPYQSDNIFTDVDGGLYTGYVRAISGCGSLIASEPFLIINYPTFFTPNGDGINETWRPLGLENFNITSEVDICVYDRHGKLLTRLDPLGPGWDGTYNGQLMTSTDYWFKAFFRKELDNTPVFFNGHFSLKR
jgi:gliding motility-associated-like protein